MKKNSPTIQQSVHNLSNTYRIYTTNVFSNFYYSARTRKAGIYISNLQHSSQPINCHSNPHDTPTYMTYGRTHDLRMTLWIINSTILSQSIATHLAVAVLARLSNRRIHDDGTCAQQCHPRFSTQKTQLHAHCEQRKRRTSSFSYSPGVCGDTNVTVISFSYSPWRVRRRQNDYTIALPLRHRPNPLSASVTCINVTEKKKRC